MSTQSLQPQTMNQLLDERVRDSGDTPALIRGDDTITFAALAADARRLAAGLAAQGVGPGDKVAIWLANGPEWIALVFALARLGAVAVAINTQYRRHEVEDIVHRSGARLLVLQPRFRDADYLALVDAFDDASLASLERVVVVGDETVPSTVKARPAVSYRALFEHGEHASDDARPDSPFVVFTSSGTTSAPKLVLHRQSAITHHARAVADTFGYRDTPDTVVLGMLPFCGVFGFNTVMGTLAAGRPLVVMTAFDAAEAVACIERHRVTHSNGSDEMFRRILAAAEPAARIASLKEGAFANFSADATSLIEQGQALDIKLFQTYGASEVQALMAYAPAGSGPERWVLGGGTPSSSAYRVRVRDPESGELAADGESGELEIAGPHRMVEYLNNAEATRAALTDDGYVCTGDLGYIEGPDSFVYLARLGDTLRLGGFLVNPREIEVYLEGFDAIAYAQVVAADTDKGPRPVAFVTLEAGREFDEQSIIDACQADMARFKAPVRIVALDAFPTTRSANGEKIQKNKLRDKAQELMDAPAPS